MIGRPECDPRTDRPGSGVTRRTHSLASLFEVRVALTLRQRELIIDRTTAALCGADYEWGIHIAVKTVPSSSC